MTQVIAGEMTTLADHEAVIERGLTTFVEVGTSLLAIREGRLYREQHGTFEDYCRERWGWSRQHANRLVAGAEVAATLEPTGSIAPTAERQVRPLTSLPTEDQPAAWRDAVDSAGGSVPTQAQVERIVRQRPSRLAPLMTSETPEWYTPPQIIALVENVLGTIDLDPCSNSKDAPNVPALQHFTVSDDGLSREWHGRVYMNPPYGTEIAAWVSKLVAEHAAGRTIEAIALVPARTDTRWWNELVANGRFFSLVEGRLRFSGAEAGAPFPNAVVYLGQRGDRFLAAFRPGYRRVTA